MNTTTDSRNGTGRFKDPYEVMGLQRTATADEIKRAYRQLALRYHPDKLVNVPHDERIQAKHKFQELSTANAILSNPNKKAVYDSDGENGIRMMDQFGEDIYMRVHRFGPWLKGLMCFIGVITCGFCCCFGCCFCCFCFCCGKCRPKVDDDDDISSIFRMEEGGANADVVIEETYTVQPSGAETTTQTRTVTSPTGYVTQSSTSSTIGPFGVHVSFTNSNTNQSSASHQNSPADHAPPTYDEATTINEKSDLKKSGGDEQRYGTLESTD